MGEAENELAGLRCKFPALRWLTQAPSAERELTAGNIGRALGLCVLGCVVGFVSCHFVPVPQILLISAIVSVVLRPILHELFC